jgi:hypothetical protein
MWEVFLKKSRMLHLFDVDYHVESQVRQRLGCRRAFLNSTYTWNGRLHVRKSTYQINSPSTSKKRLSPRSCLIELNLLAPL